jgi:LuxR family transcriptional regulator, maltose regulon positive regulatory protein
VDTLVLATKVRAPPPPQHVVSRPRLTDSLEQHTPHYRLIVLAAPAGYGKTTLLADWAQVSQLALAWLTLGAQDNDPERFLRYLVRAWEQVQPEIGETRLGLLLRGMAPDIDAVLAAIINVASDLSDHLAFVLDDYHLISEPAIHHALTFLVDHLPPTLHFVIAGRSEPPLPLARYRARHELLELRAEDLQFAQAETAAFLRQAMRLDLSDDDIVNLHSQLEGWIAGIQLAALSLRSRTVAGDAPVITGRHRFIADYLGQEILLQLPTETQLFLLQTSMLSRLCGPLCDAVTTASGSQEVLESLERQHLFVVALDDRREWYRYHRLFAEFLEEELRRRHGDHVVLLHRRAARWYLANDSPEPAFDHAVAGNDPDLVIGIFERYGPVKLNSGEFKLVSQWLDALPAAWFSAYPLLNLFRAGLLAYVGPFDACVRCVDDVEQRLRPLESEDTPWQLAMVTAIRCFIACMQNDLGQAQTLADRALRDLRQESLSFRASIYHALGDTNRRHGRWQDAKAYYLKVLSFTDSPGFPVQSAHVYGALADLELRQGHLRAAAAYWQQALDVIQHSATWGRLPLPVIGWVYIRMSEILYEWNRLDEAGDYLARGLEYADLGGDVRALVAGYLLQGRLRLTAGDLPSAEESLARARPLLESAQLPEWTASLRRLQVDVWLAQNRLLAALRWADEMLRSAELVDLAEHDAARLGVARVLLEKGDAHSLEGALALLKQLHESSAADGRAGIQIEALALQAIAYGRRGEPAAALTALERSLRLAEPEGYVRLFADLGLPIARVLQEARSRDVMPDFVARLLAAYNDHLVATPSGDIGLPEQLTHREQEVLELLACGLTNREIAAQLVVSPETVKKHTGSIYGKLGVSNRTEAVARARALSLLG